MLASLTTPIKSIGETIFAPSALNQLARLLEDRFTLPGTSLRVGWDFIIGLVPLAGDAITTVVSLYIVAGALYHRAETRTVAHMLMNVAIDFLIGLIPVIGDFLDARWRANLRNVHLLNEDLARRGIAAR